jgi:hypothetical protein
VLPTQHKNVLLKQLTFPLEEHVAITLLMQYKSPPSHKQQAETVNATGFDTGPRFPAASVAFAVNV